MIKSINDVDVVDDIIIDASIIDVIKMEKADPDSPKLTEHDKDVLRKIIEHSKIPDSQIAQDIGISPQAVFKIRNKLEEIGVIKGYTPIIDFKKIGITVLVVLIIRVKPEIWSTYPDYLVSERIAKIPYIISAFRVADARASHILLIGFRNTEQKEHYLSNMQTKSADKIEIRDVYTFSVDQIIVDNNPIGLLHEIIDQNEFSKYEIFPDKFPDKKKL